MEHGQIPVTLPYRQCRSLTSAGKIDFACTYNEISLNKQILFPYIRDIKKQIDFFLKKHKHAIFYFTHTYVSILFVLVQDVTSLAGWPLY